MTGQDGKWDRAHVRGARETAACISHELAGPLTALATHLKLALRGHDDPSLEAAQRCVDRLREITVELQRAGRSDDDAPPQELSSIVHRAGAGLGREVAQSLIATLPPMSPRIELALRPALAAVAHAEEETPIHVQLDGDADTARIRIHTGALDGMSEWRLLAPFADRRLSLELWLTGIAALELGGVVRVARRGTSIAVLLELPLRPA